MAYSLIVDPCSCPPVPVVTDCPPPKGCKISLPADCVFYNGPDLNCSGGRSGQSFGVILSQMDAAICTAIGTTILQGDVTGSGRGMVQTTLKTVNTTTGIFGGTGFIPSLTVNEKGLITHIENVSVTIPSGGLTSIGLSMPTAFTVLNTPLTQNGVIQVTANGSPDQYITGNGNLATMPAGYWELEADNVSLHTEKDTYKVGIGGIPTQLFDVQDSGSRMAFQGGLLTLYDKTTSQNIKIGDAAATNLGGSSHIAIGVNSLLWASNGSSSRNIAIGIEAGYQILGSRNVAIGVKSMTAPNSDDNTGVGDLSQFAMLGKQNTALGSAAQSATGIKPASGAAAPQGGLQGSVFTASSTSITDNSIGTFITTRGLLDNTDYMFRLKFDGTPPPPLPSGTKVYVRKGRISNQDTITFSSWVTFGGAAVGTWELTAYNQQSNSIAIGYGVESGKSNEVTIGNASNDLLVMNQFRVWLKSNPGAATGFVLGWDPDNQRGEWKTTSELVWRTLMTSCFTSTCILPGKSVDHSGQGYSQVTGSCGIFQGATDKSFVITENCYAENLTVALRDTALEDITVELIVNGVSLGSTGPRVFIPKGSTPRSFTDAVHYCQLQAGWVIAIRYSNGGPTALSCFLSNGLTLASSH